MRLVVLSAAAALVAATPAVANEIRAEARGGAIWAEGNTEAVAGVALGYDFDLGETAFVGADVSADKILAGGNKVAFAVTGRGGAKIGAGKLFVEGGYTSEFADEGDGMWLAGAGYQHSFGEKLYGKIAYRHFFVKNSDVDFDAVLAGVGVKF